MGGETFAWAKYCCALDSVDQFRVPVCMLTTTRSSGPGSAAVDQMVTLPHFRARGHWQSGP